ncbi:MAG: phenylacetate--CoA ligase family protein [Granulosicoccaceae bacterium]
MSDKYFDALETRDPETRAREQLDQLNQQISYARANAPALQAHLQGAPNTLTSLQQLAQLPVLRKSMLVEAQADKPPFGGLAALGWGDVTRVFASPGPIHEPEAAGSDVWRTARALHAAGIRKGMLLHNTFSYHFTPAGSMLESGAHALGCAVFPAGVGQTEMQVAAMAHLAPDGYIGTPSFLRILLNKAKEDGLSLSSLKYGLVGGEALPPSLRTELQEHGVSVLQCYATAELGLISYESEALEGMIVDEGVIVEIVRPGTGEPVPVGEVGEVLVTLLSNRAYPLIRFATGDLSKFLEGQSPCGRTNVRLAGWMGRADQSAKVKGMFVRPEQVAAIVQRHPEVIKARLVVTNADHNDSMELICESSSTDEALVDAIVASVRELTKLRGSVKLLSEGELANDGLVIEDKRTYE